jgi:hypothetical protein
MKRLIFCMAATLVAASAVARQIRIVTEPPGRNVQVTIHSLQIDTAKPIRVAVDASTLATVTSLRFPLQIEASGFGPVVYTDADAAAGKPAVLRALGNIKGVLTREKPTFLEKFVFLLKRADNATPAEVTAEVTAEGKFDIVVPAGTYNWVALSDRSASRIRSGIVVKPAEATNAGKVQCERTVGVSVRVVSAKSRTPIAGAQVTWNPPNELNASTARVLFSRRWSGVTGRDGVVSLRSIGPVPIPARWHVEAGGYSPVDTAVVQIREDRHFSIPDVQLRSRGVVIVNVTPPRRGAIPHGSITLCDVAPENPLRFRETARADLRVGDTRFENAIYGSKRVVLKNTAGATIAYKDFIADAETTRLNVEVEPIEIGGSVMQGAAPVEGARVVFADPHDGRVVLGEATSGPAGSYRITTYQRGQVSGYATRGGGRGRVSGAVTQQVTIAPGQREVTVDFELPTSRLVVAVVDAATNQPIPRVTIDRRIALTDGNYVMGVSQTDETGRLVLENYPEGTATLIVRANGYRSSEVTVPLQQSGTDARVSLERSAPVVGRVISSEGSPINGARVSGGYLNELSHQASFETTTDATGMFRLDAVPPIGTIFYVVAAGYALTASPVHPGSDNMIIVAPPSANVAYLRSTAGGSPGKVYRVVASIHGSEMIPLGVLDDLAAANGMEEFQFLGSGRDGSVVLPQFLGPGTYDLYITKRGGKPYLYVRVGTIHAPLTRDETLTVNE